MTEINTALTTLLIKHFKPQIESQVTAQFSRLVERFGQDVKGVTNSTSYQVWNTTVRPCCSAELHIGRVTAWVLDSYKLSIFAQNTAELFADEVLAKVNSKCGELDDATISYIGGADFRIIGTKGASAVVIDQQQIINVSVKGKLFNQYPARIYVDGNFTPAAAFKRQFA